MKRERLGYDRSIAMMAFDQDPRAALVAKLRGGAKLSDGELDAIESALMGRQVAADDPPEFFGRPAGPKRLDPNATVVKPGAGARQQNVPEATDDGETPAWIDEILAAIRQHVPDQVHARLREKLHAMHTAGWRPAAQGEPTERGELREEDPDGLDRPARPAMDAWIQGLPRHLVSFRQTDFGPRH